MEAAVQGIELGTLELVSRSRPDTRGLPCMADDGGEPV